MYIFELLLQEIQQQLALQEELETGQIGIQARNLVIMYNSDTKLDSARPLCRIHFTYKKSCPIRK